MTEQEREALGSICWGISVVAIAGGLWLLGWLPQKNLFVGLVLLLGMGLGLLVHGLLSLRAHRTGTERAHRRVTTFNMIVFSTMMFIGAVSAAILIAACIELPLGIDDRFFFVTTGVVLVVLALVATVSYFWRRARNPTVPAPTFLVGHVAKSVGIAFSGSLAISMALLFGFVLLGIVRGSAGDAAWFLWMGATISLFIFAQATWILWGIFRRDV